VELPPVDQTLLLIGLGALRRRPCPERSGHFGLAFLDERVVVADANDLDGLIEIRIGIVGDDGRLKLYRPGLTCDMRSIFFQYLPVGACIESGIHPASLDHVDRLSRHVGGQRARFDDRQIWLCKHPAVESRNR
jgi:hypothetical protein